MTGVAGPAPDAIIAGYARAAEALIPSYETAVTTEALLAPVAALLPEGPGRMLDLGAGTGRDAAWFAARGFDVLALEPVAAFRAAGARHGPGITWRDDRLPELSSLTAADGPFDLVLANGVWHHLTPAAQIACLHPLCGLTRPGGRLILSLRHGPTPADRPGHPIDPDRLIRHAGARGFSCLSRVEAASHQPGNRASGVTWTWCVFERDSR